MKQVFLPSILGCVPEDMAMCLSSFLDVCYISHWEEIDSNALLQLDNALVKFKELREIFRTSGVHLKGFLLPRQHSIFHYCQLIEDFGAPNGLCSSITESRHIMAVKKPWRQSN